MRFLLIFLIIFFLQSCKETGRKYYIIIDVEKKQAKEGDTLKYTITDSAFFKSDTAAAWEGVRRRWEISKIQEKQNNFSYGSYDLKVLDENKHDVLDRLTDSFKTRLWDHIPEND